MSIKDHTPVYFCLAVLIVTLYSFIIFSDHAYAWSNDPKVNTSICTSGGDQHSPVIISDGVGGAIITWYRGAFKDIYSQRLDANGNPTWATNGAAISEASEAQRCPAITSHELGGAIIAWEEYRWEGESNCDIYDQLINGLGVPQWTPENGVAICRATNYQLNPKITNDGAGGAIITWEDERSSSNFDIYAQQIDRDGILGRVHGKKIDDFPWLFLLLGE
jgi:hypothetical protein